MRTLTKSRRYLLSDEMVEQLKKLKVFNIIESRFVRLAIEEKLQRDLPKLKIKKQKDDCPF